MNPYIKEMRIKHWYKALIVFSGPLFSGMLLSLDIGRLFLTFLAFGFVASSVYVMNDIKDAEKDRLHPKKKHRPIASRKIGEREARIFLSLLLAVAVGLGSYLGNSVLYLLISYFGLMFIYTYALKRLAVVDAFVIATGFVIRAVAGCLAVGIKITPFFYLVIFSFAVYLAFCKRLTETKVTGKAHRSNLAEYEHIVEIGVAVSGAISLALYAIYTLEKSALVWSFPFAFLGLMLHLREAFSGNEVHESLGKADIFLTGAAFVAAVFIGLY